MYMLSFKDSVIVKKIGLTQNSVNVMRHKFRNGTLTERGMIAYLIRFGFPFEINFLPEKLKLSAKKV